MFSSRSISEENGWNNRRNTRRSRDGWRHTQCRFNKLRESTTKGKCLCPMESWMNPQGNKRWFRATVAAEVRQRRIACEIKAEPSTDSAILQLSRRNHSDGWYTRQGTKDRNSKTTQSRDAKQNSYISQEYDNFAKTWGFQHKTSSPTYPQSNGLAERTVETVQIY